MEKNLKNKIIVILGLTSSGKSDVAIKLAKKFDGEIISADSRQIYRKLNLGTGKIIKDPNLTPALSLSRRGGYYSEGIPHYLIDIITPTGNYNASHFKKDAQIFITDILKRGKLPIICGGTGFWIKAVVDNVNFPEVKPNKKLRQVLEKYPAVKLFKILQKLDPERAKNIDRFNKIRLIRAIEICKAIGKVPKLDQKRSDLLRPRLGGGEVGPLKFFQIGINVPKEKLYANIKKRLQKRFKQGMIEEVKKLRKSGLSWKKIQSFGLGYYWIPKYIKGEIKTKKELFEKVYLAEKDYAKRQMTWFRKDKRIKWLKDYINIEKEVKKF